MRKFKITFLLIIIGLLITNVVLAQDNLLEKEKAIQDKIEELNQVYSLTKEQRKAVKQPIIDFIEKQEELKSLEVSSYYELKEAYRKASKAFHETVKDLLTARQVNSKSATYYYPRFKVKSNKKICVVKEGREILSVVSRMYRNENMKPNLAVQRKKLEAQISKKDKKAIVKLRQGFFEAQEAVEEFQKNNQYGMISAAGLNRYQNKIYAILGNDLNRKRAKIMDLVAKYDEEIEVLFEEIEPAIMKWKFDLGKMEYKYFPEKEAMQAKWTEEEKLKVEENKMQIFKFDFLLLDYNFSNALQNKMTIDENCFGSSNMIQLELKEAGKITIELLDSEGKLVQTVLSEHRIVGLHIIKVDFLNIKGRHSCFLKTADGEEIKVYFLAKIKEYLR